jgi:hypothetical protein
MVSLLALGLADQLKPVVMSEVAVGAPTPIRGGRVTPIIVGDAQASLFIPEGWRPQARNRVAVHFHSAPWYVISQYQAARFGDPVLVCNFGQGSSIYARPFSADRRSFDPWKRQLEFALKGKLGNLVVTSFSAGYGAVRELIKQPDFLNRLETVILSDSMYGSFLTPRTVDPEYAKCWVPLLERGLSGRTSVVVTCSSIAPETYAGTHEVSKAAVELMGKRMVETPNEVGAQRLFRRFDERKLHVWHYDGTSPTSHMTQARHMVDILRSVNGNR